MGNCLVLQDNTIKVVKSDGKILQYRAPIKVDQVLSQFSGHALSESVSGFRHLQPDMKLISGRLYYLTPAPMPSPKSKNKKKVRFLDQVVDGVHEQGTTAGVVRIKLLVTKQELQEMLLRGAVPAQDLVSKIVSEKNKDQIDSSDTIIGREWKTVLDSIPELD